MDLLAMTKPLKNDHPFVKAAFQGFQGSGKTFTMMLMAAGLRELIKAKDNQDAQLVIYDTEIASSFLLPQLEKRGITDARVIRSRSLQNLNDLMNAAEKFDRPVILLIDSITHVWKNVVDEWKTQKKRSYLTMHDWGILIPKWEKEFSARFLESKVHILFTGRAGYSYDHDVDEDTGKKELNKSGVRMKVQGETSFEPSLLIHMEQLQELDKKGRPTVKVSATVLKDRFDMIHGATFVNPTFSKFKPLFKKTLSGTAADVVFQDSSEQFRIEDSGRKWKEEKEASLEEIQNIFTVLGFGNSAKDKQLKFKILETLFEQLSWKAIEGMKLQPLKAGLNKLRDFRKGWEAYVKDQNDTGQPVDTQEAYSILEYVTATPGASPEPAQVNNS